MRVELQATSARPFRPRLHATLSGEWTKNSLLTLVGGIAHRIGLNATDVMVLRRIAQKTRATDYADPARSPICFERQIDMAASVGLSVEQWRRIERKLEHLGIVARETATNGYRGRVSGSSGLEACAGLSLEPLIGRLEDLVETEAREVEMTERLAMCRLEISKARREIRHLEGRGGVEDPVLLADIAGAREVWVSPRGYTTLAKAEDHLAALECLAERLRQCAIPSPNMTGAAVVDDRCHKQNTTETSSESCRMPDGPEDRGKKREAPDAGVNDEFMSCLSVAKLRDLASEEMRLYIDHAPRTQAGGPPTLSDVDWAVLQRLRELGINPSAFEEAMEAMGWLRALLSVIVIDRNRDHPTRPIRNCGGALRAFTRRYGRGELDLRASIFGIWGREGRMQ